MTRSDDTTRTDRVRWCLRTYGRWVLAAVPVFAALALILAPAGVRYEAQAVVYVRGLQVSSKVLPPLAEAVFDNGSIEDEVVTGMPQVAHAGSLIPDQLELLVVEDSVAFLVLGRDADPTVAAGIANTAASVFVDELNRAGPDIGTFAIQSEARVPVEPMPVANAVVVGVAGGLVGLLLVLGGIVLAAVLRRPVVGAPDVEALLGARHLGTVVLAPPRPGDTWNPGTPGVAPVARKLAPVEGVVLVLGEATCDALRQRVVVLLAVTLARMGATTRVVGPAPVLAEVEAAVGHDVSPEPGLQAEGELILVDGPETRATFRAGQRSPGVVLVARRGIPSARLSSMAVGFAPVDLLGVVLVEIRRLSPSERAPAPQPAPQAPRSGVPR